jgi:drug/metabolite transporter (DMT)-like permease
LNVSSDHALPALRGGLLAALSATLFGVTTPLLKTAGAGVGPFATAALLYAGAALVALAMRLPASREARVRPADLKRLVTMAALGAVVGPVALAWGLQRTSATSASLMLALEALCTVVFARLLYRETMDRRVWSAMLLLFAGGCLLVVDQGRLGRLEWLGLAAVVLATVAWGLDNTLSRALADRDPGQVVLLKAGLGAVATSALAVLLQERAPGMQAALALLAIGATGYGLSLRLYLLAQRRFGAARTGSVFALAPFVGAATAVLMGERDPSPWLAVAAASMLAGVVLHLSERHAHEHEHDALEHEHAHVHDDGHHRHRHEPMPEGAHSHPHRHEPIRHAHPHVPDLHHTHEH